MQYSIFKADDPSIWGDSAGRTVVADSETGEWIADLDNDGSVIAMTVTEVRAALARVFHPADIGYPEPTGYTYGQGVATVSTVWEVTI